MSLGTQFMSCRAVEKGDSGMVHCPPEDSGLAGWLDWYEGRAEPSSSEARQLDQLCRLLLDDRAKQQSALAQAAGPARTAERGQVLEMDPEQLTGLAARCSQLEQELVERKAVEAQLREQLKAVEAFLEMDAARLAGLVEQQQAPVEGVGRIKELEKLGEAVRDQVKLKLNSQIAEKAQQAAMRQVRLVLKGMMQGAVGVAVHEWFRGMEAQRRLNCESMADAVAQLAAVGQLRLIMRSWLADGLRNAVCAWQSSLTDEKSKQKAAQADQMQELALKDGAMRQVRLVLKGMLQGKAAVAVQLWCQGLAEHKHAMVKKQRDVKTRENLAVVKQLQQQMLQEHKEQKDGLAQQAAMRQVRLVLKGMMQGALGVAVRDWALRALGGPQQRKEFELERSKRDLRQLKVLEGLEQHGKKNAQKAAMTQVKFLLQGMLHGNLASAVRRWCCNFGDAQHKDAVQDGAMRRVRLVLKGMLQGKAAVAVQLWCQGLAEHKHAMVKKQRDVKTREGLAAVKQLQQQMLQEHKEQKDGLAQQAAMRQVRLVLKGMLQGKAAVAVQLWCQGLAEHKHAMVKKQRDVKAQQDLAAMKQLQQQMLQEHKEQKDGLAQQAAMRQVRLVLKGMLQGKAAVAVQLWCQGLAEHKHAMVKKQRDVKAQQDLAAVKQLQQQMLQEHKEQKDGLAQQAAMRQVRLVLKGMMEGAVGVAVHEWVRGMEAQRRLNCESITEQRAKETAHYASMAEGIARNAAMKQVKLVLQAQLHTVVAAAVHKWSRAASKQRAVMNRVRLAIQSLMHGQVATTVQQWHRNWYDSKKRSHDEKVMHDVSQARGRMNQMNQAVQEKAKSAVQRAAMSQVRLALKSQTRGVLARFVRVWHLGLCDSKRQSRDREVMQEVRLIGSAEFSAGRWRRGSSCSWRSIRISWKRFNRRLNLGSRRQQ